jgi:hypothetical protein
MGFGFCAAMLVAKKFALPNVLHGETIHTVVQQDNYGGISTDI